MRTKLYVLGAVLGAAPGLLPVVSTPWATSPQEARQESRGGSSRKGRGHGRAESAAPAGTSPGVASPPDLSGPGGSKHPCELITVVKVPCEGSADACEYTYWQCPEQVKPLRA
ncbi:hypothetical protein P2318_29120 [Myxococcaceae bacterium GXIMD 01537]